MTRNEIIETLKANREAVISELNWQYRKELRSGSVTLKSLMERVIERCVENEACWMKNRTAMRNCVKDMAASDRRMATENYNLETYGTRNPKMADIIAHYAEVTGDYESTNAAVRRSVFGR